METLNFVILLCCIVVAIGIDYNEPECSEAISLNIDSHSIPCGSYKEYSFVSSTESPTVVVQGVDQNAEYAVIMYDPDAPSKSNHRCRNWRHWVVVNVKEGSLTSGHIKGDTLTEYHPPSPPEGSGKHRYVVIVLRQDNHINPDPIDSSRCEWNPAQWISASIPSGEQAIVAATYFLTERPNAEM